MTRAAGLIPEVSFPRYNLARFRFEKRINKDQALTDIETALDLDQDNIKYLLLLGRIRNWRGEKEEAVNAFRRVKSLDPENQEASQYLGEESD